MAVKALYAGTFDPFTNGHHDIALRALRLFDFLTVLVAVPPKKTPFLDSSSRVRMIAEIFKDEKKIDVVSWNRLIIDYARIHNMKAIVRGLRPTGDFDTEFQLATMNRNLNPDVETVFITTSGHSYYISSSLVKEIFFYGGDVKSFVPEVIYREMQKYNKP